ncbi:uncharacterized protein LOC106674160 isoform X2 [Cimex lectularius]|uniref:Myb-like domain-containing protein n=1 Tax=Cimex lectularius TaxID=79782 RepID=A0A8I6SD36_CIMLE|nr:uncharacterized protein LOC106674160 isoform X2 [Cimex lectularius]
MAESSKRTRRLRVTSPCTDKYNRKWSVEEKTQLLDALKTIGPKDIDQIATHVPSKHKHQITTFINYLKRKAKVIREMRLQMKYVDKMSNIKEWISWAKRTSTVDSIGENLPLLFSILAILKFEKFPSMNYSDKDFTINFNEAYLFLFYLLNGNKEQMRVVSEPTRSFVFESIKMAAKSSVVHSEALTKIFNGKINPLQSFLYPRKMNDESVQETSHDQEVFLESTVNNPLMFPRHTVEVNSDLMNHYIELK